MTHIDVRNPVFLCGTSRSGTSVIQAALEKDPDCSITGETHYFDDLRVTLRQAIDRPMSVEEFAIAEDYFMALTHRPYGHAGVAGAGWLKRGDIALELGAATATPDEVFIAYNRLYAAHRGATWGGEKTPRHVFRIPEILEACPDAKVIVMLRDPRAVVASYRDWKPMGGLEPDSRHEEALAVESIRTTASYHPITIALLWKAAVRAALNGQERFGCDRVRLQSYEATVQDPDRELKELFSWLGSPLPGGVVDVPTRNSSYEAYSEGGGFRTSAIGRWRSLLAPGEVRAIEQAAGPLLRSVGYESTAQGGWGGALRLWGTFVPSAVRAIQINAGRSGNLPSYVWRRAKLAFGRS